MAWNLKQQSYSTRCWRGLFYRVREANQILHVLISRVGLEDLFSVTTSDSGVTIDYQFARYVFLYDSIRDMLYENSAKLK